jgi:hypothetical protein
MTAPREQSPFDEEFDTLVKEVLEKWKVPGLSIAVVDGPNTYSKVRMMTQLEESNTHRKERRMAWPTYQRSLPLPQINHLHHEG